MLIYMNSDIYCPTITFPPLDILAYLAQKVLKQKWLIDSLMLYFPFKDLTVWLFMATSTCNGETKGLRVYPACTFYFCLCCHPGHAKESRGRGEGEGAYSKDHSSSRLFSSKQQPTDDLFLWFSIIDFSNFPYSICETFTITQRKLYCE